MELLSKAFDINEAIIFASKEKTGLRNQEEHSLALMAPLSGLFSDNHAAYSLSEISAVRSVSIQVTSTVYSITFSCLFEVRQIIIIHTVEPIQINNERRCRIERKHDS